MAARTVRLMATRGQVKIWTVATDEGIYRILNRGANWRLERRETYGRQFQPVEGLDVATFCQVHWLTLADA